jgi:proteasome lid subunit RPN8/RPN11
MKIVVAKSELTKLRRRMIRAYPAERLEHIWGKCVGKDEVHIYMFETVKQKSTRKSCEVKDKDDLIVLEQESEARLQGMYLVGSVHSHPTFMEASPSEFDLEDEDDTEGEVVMGIVGVWLDEKQNRMHTRVRFYGPQVPVQTITTF